MKARIIARNISERKRTEQALHQGEERFRRLVQATFEGMGITESGKIVDVNPALATMFGYEPAQLVGKPAWEIVAPASRELIRNNSASRHEKAYEAVGLKSDGSTFPIEIRERSEIRGERAVRVTAIRDLTERKQAEVEFACRAHQMTALSEVALELAGPQFDVEHLADLIARRAMTLLGADGAGVWLPLSEDELLGGQRARGAAAGDPGGRGGCQCAAILRGAEGIG